MSLLDSEKVDRNSVNETIDTFKEFLGFRFDLDICKLLNVHHKAIAICRYRESPTVLFPIMDYCVAHGISIEKIFYKARR